MSETSLQCVPFHNPFWRMNIDWLIDSRFYSTFEESGTVWCLDHSLKASSKMSSTLHHRYVVNWPWLRQKWHWWLSAHWSRYMHAWDRLDPHHFERRNKALVGHCSAKTQSVEIDQRWSQSLGHHGHGIVPENAATVKYYVRYLNMKLHAQAL